MGNQQQKREPLLYIHQPEFQRPAGKMQESFSVKQAEKRKQQLVKQKKSQSTMVDEGDKKAAGNQEIMEESVGYTSVKNETSLSSEQVQKTIEEYDNTNSAEEQKRRQHGFSFKRVKPFREMDINEKLDYLANFPKQLPPVPCLFQTENKAMRGILVDRNAEQVVLKLFDKTEVEVPVKDITEIRIIGL